MALKSVVVENGASLRVKNSQLIIAREEQASVPLEDIGVVVLDSSEVSITASALAAIAENGIGVIVCSRNHMPIGLSLPLGSHSRHAAIVRHQLVLTEPFKKRAWQKIVIRKIENQAEVLRLFSRPGSEQMASYAKEVKSGDPDNREAVAARYYFPRLKDGFVRSGDSYESTALDYGYAIIRAAIARAVVARGFITSQGVHHASELNAFNLVDDLIEPFRPMIDVVVAGMDFSMEEFTKEHRHRLVGILQNECIMESGVTSISLAIESMCESFRQAVELGEPKALRLPKVVREKKRILSKE